MKFFWIGLCLFFIIFSFIGMVVANPKTDKATNIFSKNTRRKVITPILIFFYLASSFGLISAIRVKPIIKDPKIDIISPNIPSPSQIQEKKEPKSPEKGSLEYEFISSKKNPTGSLQFVYSTPERREQRLIDLNKYIISELTKNKQIDKSTTYTINYFDNTEIAKSYYIKIINPKTTADERQLLKNSFVAIMTYNKKMGINSFVRLGDAKILK